jgi:hypothetical protein
MQTRNHQGHQAVLILLVSLCFSPTLAAQAPDATRSRITQAVDDGQRVTLKGNTHPAVLHATDLGVAPPDMPTRRALLVLKRSGEQEAALQRLIENQQDKNSPDYHKWLTPDEFGRQFGPSDQDVQAVTSWLESHGFQVARIARGRIAIEFSGTAAQIEETFHAPIHKFMVEGKEHWANANDPEIPSALAPVVGGVVSLHNFPRKSMIVRATQVTHIMARGETLPFFTTASGRFDVGPFDFATIYNVLPLWTAAPTPIDGTGQTVAVVGDSNINIQDARDFRNLFGLPANDPQIILDGPDPGVNGDEIEAALDVQWVGAVARNAAILLVIAADTLTSAGADLAAFHIVDNNLAPVMSESFGACESSLGASGNAFFAGLWEQAAAQGISVFLSTGDGGSAGCDNFNTASSASRGLAVSGIGSTPFNVAVGGTDFDDALDQSMFWNSTNAPGTRVSAKSYIPELTWNDTCAQAGLTGCSTPSGGIIAGSGGQSSIYAKPSWQTGTGVPTANLRYVPDISLFASDGNNKSAYVMCLADFIPPTGAPSCNPAGGSFSFLGVGGTSVSSPAMAGIMALVNQKNGGRQGNPNFVFYKLAAKPGASCDSSLPATITNTNCIFYDITKGNISVPCTGGSLNCSSTTASSTGVLVDPANLTTPAWITTPGYDRATGLGTVNANNLVTQWSSVTFTGTTTTFNVTTAPPFTHGQSIALTISVAANAGSVTPTGDVSLIAQLAGSASKGVDGFTLANGTTPGTATVPAGAATSILFPGGTYTITAHYAGDGVFGASDSAPVSVTVAQEASRTLSALVTFDAFGNILNGNASTTSYGSPYIFRMRATNNSGSTCTDGIYDCPSGTLALTDNGAPLDGGSFLLDSFGVAEDLPIQLTGGVHPLLVSYPGDNSYLASSVANTITITKATTIANLNVNPTTVGPTQTVTLTALFSTQSNGAAPTGTVAFFNGATPLAGTVILTGTAGGASGSASLQGVLLTTFAATATITAQYSGDTNYASSTTAGVIVTVGAPDFGISVVPPTTQNVSPGGSATFTITITPSGGFAGTVTPSCTGLPSVLTCGAFNPATITPPNTTATVSVTASASANLPGSPILRRPFDLRPRILWLFTAFVSLAMAAAWRAGRFPHRRRHRLAAYAVLGAVAMLLAMQLTGCGKGASSGGGGGGVPAARIYTVTFTGTSGATTHSTTATLSVQ